MHEVNVAVAICAAAVMSLGLLSAANQRSVLTAPIIALATGIGIGPVFLGWLSPDDWPQREQIL